MNKVSIPLYGQLPWRARHYADHSKIEACFDNNAQYEAILTVHSVAGATAEVIAELILSVVNDIIRGERLMKQAMTTMQEFLIENDFEPKVEQPVIDLVKRIKRTYGLRG